MFKIDQGVPIPPALKREKLRPQMREAMLKMNPGDSFKIGFENFNYGVVRATFYALIKELEMDGFTMQKQGDYARIWKV